MGAVGKVIFVLIMASNLGAAKSIASSEATEPGKYVIYKYQGTYFNFKNLDFVTLFPVTFFIPKIMIFIPVNHMTIFLLLTIENNHNYLVIIGIYSSCSMYYNCNKHYIW